MAKKGENIYKRKDGRYEGRYVIGKRPDGRTKFGYVYGRRLTEVRNILLMKKAERLRMENRAPASRTTFGSWVEEWLKNELRGSVKPSSYQTYLGILRRHLLPAFAHLPLGEITVEAIRDFVEALEGKGLAASSVKGIVRVLSAILNSALEGGLIRANPCRKLKIRTEPAANQRILGRQEQRLLLQSFQNGGAPTRRLPGLLSLYTGMRLGEICALRWQDIDWERKTLTVRHTAQRLNVGGKGSARPRCTWAARSPRVPSASFPCRRF